MSFSNYTAQAILNALFGKTSNFGALASAPTVYVALSSTTPTEAGANVTEPSGGSYARVETAASDWNAATDADPSVVTNAEAVTFPEATATWVSGANLTHAVLYDAATDGNVLGSGALGTPKPVTEGDTAEIAAGDVSISLD
jgi:hypothetical protein